MKMKVLQLKSEECRKDELVSRVDCGLVAHGVVTFSCMSVKYVTLCLRD